MVDKMSDIDNISLFISTLSYTKQMKNDALFFSISIYSSNGQIIEKASLPTNRETVQ